MNAAEKSDVMDRFRRNEVQVLVSTVVIEVGIDVPNATVMVIEDADRFGLSQLHQIRGRIGRGKETSYCFLFAKTLTEAGQERLKVLLKTDDGFEIAEEDFRLRGPGEFFGTRQHGMPELKIADLTKDLELLRKAREDAFAWVDADGELKSEASEKLRARVKRVFAERIQHVGIG